MINVYVCVDNSYRTRACETESEKDMMVELIEAYYHTKSGSLSNALIKLTTELNSDGIITAT